MKKYKIHIQPHLRGLVLSLLFLSSYAVMPGCQSVKLPTVMKEGPSLTEIEQAVNANSNKIQSLQADNATVGVTNMPGWAKCRVAYQRPGRIRVIGTANMMGRVLDTGCNDQVFWYWNKLSEPAQLSWCQLNEYSSSPFAQTLGIDPAVFPEVFGVVEFKPDGQTEGPVSQSDKTLLLTTRLSRPDGQYTKRVYVEPKTAAIRRQDLVNPQGAVVLSVVCSEFQYDATSGVVLPKRLSITRPQTNETIHLDLGTMTVNNTQAIVSQTFEMPQAADLGNVPVVDVGKTGGTTSQPVAASVPVSAPVGPSYSGSADGSSTAPPSAPVTVSAVNASATAASPGSSSSSRPFGDFPGVTRGPVISQSSASNPTTYSPEGTTKPLFAGSVAGISSWNTTSQASSDSSATKITPATSQDYQAASASVPVAATPDTARPATTPVGSTATPVASGTAPPVSGTAGVMPGTNGTVEPPLSVYSNSPGTTSDHWRTQVLSP